MQVRHMLVHGSCAARADAGVLLVGPPGSGKSDLVLRLLARGYVLVADDQVAITDGIARPAAALAGLLEVRGLGIVRLAHAPEARLRLLVRLGPAAARLPEPETELGLPVIHVDPAGASAAERIDLGLDCALGRVTQLAGAFAA